MSWLWWVFHHRFLVVLNVIQLVCLCGLLGILLDSGMQGTLLVIWVGIGLMVLSWFLSVVMGLG